MIATAVAEAPASAAPIDATARALESIGAFFEGRHAHSRRRQAVIDANAELRERELIKLATLASALAAALRRRGVTDPAAALTAGPASPSSGSPSNAGSPTPAGATCPTTSGSPWTSSRP